MGLCAEGDVLIGTGLVTGLVKKGMEPFSLLKEGANKVTDFVSSKSWVSSDCSSPLKGRASAEPTTPSEAVTPVMMQRMDKTASDAHHHMPGSEWLNRPYGA